MNVSRLPNSLFTTGVLAAFLVVAPPTSVAAQQVPSGGLESLFEAGFLLDDRNGDGHLDFVDACLGLAAAASDDEVVAAANLAARLGFETASMDVPLRRAAIPQECDGPILAIGPAAAVLEPLRLDLTRLEPGRGEVTLIEAERRVVHIAGADGSGTRAAALLVAAHLPYLWDTDGDTLQDVAGAVIEILEAAGVTAADARVDRLAVRAASAGVDRMDLTVAVDDVDAARRALENVASATDEGAAGATDEAAPGAADEAAPGTADETAPGTTDEAAAGATDEVTSRATGEATAGATGEAAAGTTDEAAAGATGEAAPGGQEAAPEAPQDLRFDGLRLLRVRLTDGTRDAIAWIEHEALGAAAAAARPGGGDKDDLDLSNVYGNGGFFSDTDGNLIPDRVDIVLTASGDARAATADLAARIGLEATGVSIPIAKTADEIEQPENEPPLVIIGATHPLIGALIDDDKLALPQLAPGEGWVQVLREAFGERSAMIVVGGDAEGLEVAVGHVAATLPHFLHRGKDRPTVETAEEALWKVMAARSPLGQAATGLYKLDTLAARLDGEDLERVEIFLHAERTDPALGDFVRERAAQLFSADAIDVTIGNIDVRDARTIIDEDIVIPSEVDDFWVHFDDRVLPAVAAGDRVELLALLSEPPEVRAAIAERARARLLAAGAANDSEVTVLSAYKQGYSWLYDHIRPRLDEVDVGDIRIRFAEIGAPPEWPQQAMFTPTRWLLEIFPIDEVLAGAMNLDLEQITFEKMPPDAPPYEVIVTGVDGDEVLRETFAPRYVLRDYFDRFPDYEKARVTTGWIQAAVGGATVVDERIVTDLERFWDHFQGVTLMRVYDHVMQTADGKPRAADAPHFGELRIDITLSEPDYQVGVDQEQVASMEALHEEIYFSTLHFFDVMGRLARGQALAYPGRVIPIVRPKADGAAGRARITFTGFDAPAPRLDVVYTPRGGRPQTLRRDLPPVDIDRPTPLTARVSAQGIDALGFYAPVDFERDRRDEFARRASTRSIDAGITNAEHMLGTIEHASALLQAGMYPGRLSYEGLGDIDLTVGWERQRSAETERTARLVRGPTPATMPDVTALLPADDAWRDAPLVQWETPMPPGEAYAVLAKMDTFAAATAYQAGESYLGKPVWAIDLMAPVDGSHWSAAKATVLKPTVIYSARQHANEVSSTSHVLKLGEILLTGDEYPDALDDVNVVIHPITNPDGAQLAYDLYEITPRHMLHAGYLGSLGVDVTAGQGGIDPIYPETNIRPQLWNAWLPDLFLNPHGYPSHEWVQVFSEYAAWVRTRTTEQRGWWGMRGWFMPGFNYIDDERYPDHKDAAFEIRDRITAKINEATNVAALNTRAYDRYRRYAFAWDQDAFKLDFTNDVLIYTPIKGRPARDGVMSNPRVTVWSGVTEAPDETASGDWLELVATAGLQWDKALLEYLLEGNHVIERTETAFGIGTAFKIHRPRPATDPDDESTEAGR